MFLHAFLHLLTAIAASSFFGVPAGKANPDETFMGKVVAVSTDSVMLMGKDETDVKTFAVNNTTKITRNGKPAKLSEIAQGDKATVVAVAEGGKYVAKTVTTAAVE